MTTSEAMALSGTLGSTALLDALRTIARQRTYCTVQVAGGTTTGEIHLANGEIVISNAADPVQRQHQIDTVFAIMRESLTATGAFRLVPLSNIPNADSIPRIQVEAAITSATKTPAPAPAPATTPVASQTSAPTPASTTAPATAPSHATVDVDAIYLPTPLEPSALAVEPEPEEPVRRVRASQLRRILREGGSLNEHLPEAPDANGGPPNRSAALRELIGQLATE